MMKIDMIKQIYIDGFPLSNPGVSYITAVDGLTAPSISLNKTERGGRDGMVLGEPHYRALIFTITLAVVADCPANLLTQKDRLMTALRLRQTGSSKYKTVEFVMADDTRRECEALLASAPQSSLTPETAYAYLTLSTQLIAKRWYLEGEEHTLEINTPNYGGMAVPMSIPMNMTNLPGETENQAVNAGNCESQPTFRITGPLTAFDLYNSTTGQHLSVTHTLASGEYIDLDSFDHSAIANSVTNIRGKVSGDWILLAPGINELGFAAAASETGAKASITYKDTYLGI